MFFGGLSTECRHLTAETQQNDPWLWWTERLALILGPLPGAALVFGVPWVFTLLGLDDPMAAVVRVSLQLLGIVWYVLGMFGWAGGLMAGAAPAEGPPRPAGQMVISTGVNLVLQVVASLGLLWAVETLPVQWEGNRAVIVLVGIGGVAVLLSVVFPLRVWWVWFGLRDLDRRTLGGGARQPKASDTPEAHSPG